MDSLSQLALAGGLAWASGIRLYVTILVLGLLGRFGYLHLPDSLLVLQHTWVLIAAGVMTMGEFVADKVPAFDSFWDALHTFIRIPAGAFLAWGALGDATPSAQMAAAIIGGLITSGTHLAKSVARRSTPRRSHLPTGLQVRPRMASSSAAYGSQSPIPSASWPRW